ncbi:HlyD family secretion protein [Roseibium algae]|uniref:Biotin/lipoyl-binding protein n=1 Tax=Roseibium algae TaxID=3123038 RepID=A0ABU8TP05_9HYPH
MFELLFTSFPAVIRYYQLKRRGEAMTVWNMRTAVFIWGVLAFLLFTAIFYFHPKSYSGIVPFRTISVVSQANGPVTELAVKNGQQVAPGDLLFRIEDSTQKANLKVAKAELAQLTAAEAKANDSLRVAQANVAEEQATLDNLRVDLANAQTLYDKKVGSLDAVREAETAVLAAEAGLSAALAQQDLAEVDISETLPAQKKVAEANVESAQVALNQTEVRSFADGFVTQMAMSVGSPASKLILSPAMIIVPDRPKDTPVRITAGFSQVARAAIYEGMPAEIACDSNINLGFRNAILPARVLGVQRAIAAGQIVPGGQLKELNNMAGRGSILVYFELVYPEHEKIMLDGSGCIVQTYTNNMEGVFGHIIATTGIVKEIGLRLKVWGALISGIGLAGGGGH